MAKLTGPQIGQLQELVLDAFSREQFEELLLVKLNVRLDQIIPSGLDWPTSVREAIIAAEREGWTADLLRAVIEVRPRRNDIKILATQLLTSVEAAMVRAPAAPWPRIESPTPSAPPSAAAPTSKMWRWLAAVAGLLALGVALGLLLKGGIKPSVVEQAAAPPAAPATVLSSTSPPELTTPPSVPTDMSEPEPTLVPTKTPLPASRDTPAVVGQPVVAPDGATWLDVPAGEFLMGSADSDPDAQADEKPQHTVYLDAFQIMQTEVTNAMYAECVKTGACDAPSSKASYTRSSYYEDPQFANYPVINVSWTDARTYCRWIGGRLPTEAEWEKAARGTDGRIYPWGNEPPNAQPGNFNENEGDTMPAGAYPSGASPCGALDMAGNVWEWTADVYDAGYYAISPDRNPPGPFAGDERVLRGGSWSDSFRYVRAVARDKYWPGDRYEILGFRCVRSP